MEINCKLKYKVIHLEDGRMFKSCHVIGKMNYKVKSKVNFLKISTKKLALILSIALLSQAILPDGWKLTKNFNKTQNETKHDKIQNIKNYKSKNENTECIKLDGIRSNCFKMDGNWAINWSIMESLKKWSLSNKTRNKYMKTYNRNRKSCFSVMHWNLGSRHWDKKQEEIQHLVDEMNPDFLFISEANLFNDTPSHLIEIEGYTMTKAKTVDKLKYSRIVLLTEIRIIYTVEWQRMNDEIYSIWVKIGGRGRKSLRIGGMYREHFLIKQPEPNLSRNKNQQESRWKKWIHQWRDACNSGPCLVVGDMNLDLLKWENPEPFHEDMIEMVKVDIQSLNVNQVIQGPTRFWPGTTPSLIDHCWGNTAERMCNIRNLTRGTGDHNLISVSYKMSGKISSRLETKMRDRRKFSSEEFKRRLRLTSWDTVMKTDNVDIACHSFEEKFLEILDDLAPMRKVQPRKQRSDWVSPETKTLMVRRNEARDSAVASSQPEDWVTYRSLRNLCNLRVKQDRKKNLKETYERLQENNDSKGLYNLTKKKMGWKSPGTPESFMIEGRRITSLKEMAEVQANYFQEKVNTLVRNLKNVVRRWGKMNSVPEMEIRMVTEAEVVTLIKEMKSSHAFGIEGIDSEALKILPEAIAAPIANIINISIEKRKFPSRWELAHVVPLFKGGKSTGTWSLPSNLSPPSSV